MAFTNIETKPIVLLGRAMVQIDPPIIRRSFAPYVEHCDFNDTAPSAIFTTKVKKGDRYVFTADGGITHPTKYDIFT